MIEDVEGKVAGVTGAGSGIGRALALLLAQEGMHVVAADVEAESLAVTAALVLESAGSTVVTAVTDVAHADSVEAVAALAYERFGAAHLVCNNAGVFQGGVLWERTDAELD